MSSAPTEPTTSPGPPILSPQVTASEAMRIIDTDDVEDTELLAIADTLISFRAPPSYLPPPLPVQPPQHSALYSAGPGRTLDLSQAQDCPALLRSAHTRQYAPPAVDTRHAATVIDQSHVNNYNPAGRRHCLAALNSSISST